jgi:hypothetical protein
VLAMAGLSWCWKARRERRSGFAELVVASAMRAASREILDVLIAVAWAMLLLELLTFALESRPVQDTLIQTATY